MTWPAWFDEISLAVRAKVTDDFKLLGIAIKQFFVELVSPTEETQQAIDKRAAMGAVAYPRSSSIRPAWLSAVSARVQPRAVVVAAVPQRPGMSLGVGMGMGAGMAGVMAEAMQQATAPKQAPAAPAEVAPAVRPC